MISLLFLLQSVRTGVSGFVIAPPWANADNNPCSSSSWQLVFWPPTNKCYQIFSRGPCPDTQELAFNSVTGSPECRCPQHLPLHWKPTDRCYSRHSRGPCHVNQYLDLKEDSSPVCKSIERCEPGRVYWPPDKACYQLYTQGPCHKGDLLIVNPVTAEPYCGCDPLLLRQYYYRPLKLCYEHYTKGPCELGSLFSYNHTSDTTECICNQELNNYFKPLGQCFELESKGPCGKGQLFQYDKESGRAGCRCKENYVYWEKTRSCYRAFTPGPCRTGQFLVEGTDGNGFCSKNPCSKAHLYFPSADDPSQGHCHKVGGRGPCPIGELVVFEAYSGKSYRGACGCSSGYNQNYWPTDNKCYEWYSQGPCPKSFLFKYNKQKRSTECVCDMASGYVFWNETSECYKIYSRGPCPENAWLIPTGTDTSTSEPHTPPCDLSEVYCECQSGYHFSPGDYSCQRSPVIEVTRLNYLRNHRFDLLGLENDTAGSTSSEEEEEEEEVKEEAEEGQKQEGRDTDRLEPDQPDLEYWGNNGHWGDRLVRRKQQG